MADGSVWSSSPFNDCVDLHGIACTSCQNHMGMEHFVKSHQLHERSIVQALLIHLGRSRAILVRRHRAQVTMLRQVHLAMFAQH